MRRLDTPPSRLASRPTPAIAAEPIGRSVVHQVIHTITDPWKPGIVLLLWLGESRFTGLVCGLGISRSTLAQRLNHLIDDGCVERMDLLGIVLLNRQWNARWHGGNKLLPKLKLMHSCGERLSVVMVCCHCGQEAHARDVKVLETATCAGFSRVANSVVSYRRARNHRSASNGQLLVGEDLAGDRWTSLVMAIENGCAAQPLGAGFLEHLADPTGAGNHHQE